MYNKVILEESDFEDEDEDEEEEEDEEGANIENMEPESCFQDLTRGLRENSKARQDAVSSYLIRKTSSCLAVSGISDIIPFASWRLSLSCYWSTCYCLFNLLLSISSKRIIRTGSQR